jgi:biopolymer transport protein ExbD
MPASPASKSPRKLSVYHPTRPLNLWQDHSHDQGETRIEIVPLIDVIFCILTFFILGAVGLSRQQAISLDLPRASTGAPQMREMFMVSLDDLGQLYVEKQPVSESQLASALKNYHQYNPQGLIVLHASRNASYNDVVQLLDVLRQVGGDRVALATLPGEAKASPDFNSPNTGLGNSPFPDGFNTPGLNVPGTNPAPNFANPLPGNPPNSFGDPSLTNPSLNPNPAIPNVPPAPNLPGLTPTNPSHSSPR